jgi:signal transduction histidine kinase
MSFALLLRSLVAPDRVVPGDGPAGRALDGEGLDGRAPFPSVSARTADALVVAVTVALIAAALPSASEPSAQALDPLGWALGLGAALPLAIRRDRPELALLGTVVLSSAYHSMNYPGGPPQVALMVALYSCAVRGSAALAYGVAISSLTGATVYRTLIESDPPVAIAVEAAVEIGAPLLGSLVRARRAWAAEVRQRLERTAGEAEARARQRIADERLHMARELHDVVAHTLTTITVHASAASETLETDPATARASLDAIRTSSKAATEELRDAIASLRSPSPAGAGIPLGPTGTLSELRRLTEEAAAHGLETELMVPDRLPGVAPATSRAVYRIVQEALTNSVTHGGARRAPGRVEVDDGDGLRIEISDDGHGGPTDPGGGHGRVGMRERVLSVGGTLEAAPLATGGFRVAAVLPGPVVP